MAQIALLQGGLKHYDWGGYDFLPALLQVENTGHKPCAEYWLGTHPQSECFVLHPDGTKELLKDFIADEGLKALGNEVYNTFGTVPYLLKILDVRDMLSIQVHPTREAAGIHYDLEEKEGTLLTAANRNFKDRNHKPELMVSLGDFWLLHGFKPAELLVHILNEVQEMNSLLPVFEQGGYSLLYKHVMELPQHQVNNMLQPLLNRILPLYEADSLMKNDEHFWAARAAITFNKNGNIDRGIFSIYLFNLVYVPIGKAVFQDAGVPHAYLEGQNVEIMASSDNVLRGGLTPKHIDVQQLLLHTKCEATIPRLLNGDEVQNEWVFRTPAPDFELSKIHLEAGESHVLAPMTAEIILLLQGRVTVQSSHEQLLLCEGSLACLLLPGTHPKVHALEEAVLYRATVPIHTRE